MMEAIVVIPHGNRHRMLGIWFLNLFSLSNLSHTAASQKQSGREQSSTCPPFANSSHILPPPFDAFQISSTILPLNMQNGIGFSSKSRSHIRGLFSQCFYVLNYQNIFDLSRKSPHSPAFLPSVSQCSGCKK